MLRDVETGPKLLFMAESARMPGSIRTLFNVIGFQPPDDHGDSATSPVGDDAAKRKAFLDAYLILHRRISLFTALPIHKLDKLSLKAKLAEIGKSA